MTTSSSISTWVLVTVNCLARDKITLSYMIIITVAAAVVAVIVIAIIIIIIIIIIIEVKTSLGAPCTKNSRQWV